MLKLIICFVIANIGKKQSHLVNNSEKLCIFCSIVKCMNNPLAELI